MGFGIRPKAMRAAGTCGGEIPGVKTRTSTNRFMWSTWASSVLRSFRIWLCHQGGVCKWRPVMRMFGSMRSFFESKRSESMVVSPMPQTSALHNKALHQTRRGGVAHFSRRGPVVEARLAGEGRCYAGATTDVEAGCRR